MPTLYYLNLTLHLLASMVWIGGMFFLGLAGAPALRTVEPLELRQRLFHDVGIRFRRVGWWSIGVLVATGVVNIHYRGWFRGADLTGPGGFWSTSTGLALAIKLGLAGLMVVLSAIHDFALGQQASLATPGSTAAAVLRQRASIVARVNALLAVLLVVAAVRLARGG